jgi:hypothetical protein
MLEIESQELLKSSSITGGQIPQKEELVNTGVAAISTDPKRSVTFIHPADFCCCFNERHS